MVVDAYQYYCPCLLADDVGIGEGERAISARELEQRSNNELERNKRGYLDVGREEKRETFRVLEELRELARSPSFTPSPTSVSRSSTQVLPAVNAHSLQTARGKKATSHLVMASDAD